MLRSLLVKGVGPNSLPSLVRCTYNGRGTVQSDRPTVVLLQRGLSAAADTHTATNQGRGLLAEFARSRGMRRVSQEQRLSALFASFKIPGDLTLIPDALKHVKRSAMYLNPDLTSQLLDACLRCPDKGVDIAFSILRYPGDPQYPVKQVSPDTIRRLMRALHKQDRHADALDLFLAYSDVMSFPLSVFDEMFRTAMASEDLHLAAIHGFEHIREHGPFPDERTYSIIIKTALKQEEYVYALGILEHFHKDGFKMNEHFENLRQEAEEGLARERAHADS